MSDRRLRVAKTLRGRLTIGLVVVLLAACGVAGVATTLFLRTFLLDRLDSQLASAGGRFAISLEHGQFAPGGGDGDSDNATPGQSVGTLGVRLLNGKVTNAAVVGSDGKNRSLTFGARDVASLRSVHPGQDARTLRLASVGEYRVDAVTGRDGDVQVTGLPTHEVDETVARLIVIEAALFAAIVIVSGAIAAFGVSRSLRPLRQVAATAREVSDLPLTEASTTLPGRIGPDEPVSEVDQVSVAFDHMLEHIRNALAARDHTEGGLRRFVADASHELRTPLATIRAYTEFATRSEQALPEIAETAFARIDAAAARMTTLVDDLLLLARLDAGRPLARETLDITQLIIEAVDDARTATPDHDWHLDLPDEPVDVAGDSARLHQVLANLLSNAARHTPAGTTVTTTLLTEADVVSVEVEDDGPGIPADALHGLFDRFTQVEAARTSDRGNTGLGLAIAQGIAHAHGGLLTVQSVPGRTRFVLRVPAGE